MNVRRLPPFGAAAAVLAAAASSPLAAQSPPTDVARLVASAERLAIAVGETVPFTVRAVDASGGTVEVPVRVTGPREGIDVDDGFVEGLAQGEYEIVATAVLPAGAAGPPATLRVPVVVSWPAVAEVVVRPLHEDNRLFVGTTLAHRATARHADGSPRPDPEVAWRTSDASVATVDAFGAVTGVAPGEVTVTAALEGREGSARYRVAPFPGATLSLRAVRRRPVPVT